LLVLAALLWFSIGRFWIAPYAGFLWDTRDGRIVEIYVPNTPLRIGDTLEQVGETEWDLYRQDLSQRLFAGARPGDVIPLRVERAGHPDLTIAWTFPGVTQAELLQRLNSEWWLPYVFWLGGMATLFFVRPRNEQWLLMIAFNFLTAIWMGAGGLGAWRVPGSIIATRTAAWLSVPVYLHLHWQFPRPLAALPRWVWGSLYALSLILIGLEIAGALPGVAYQTGLMLALLGSMLLVGLRLIFRRRRRPEARILGGALMLALLPMVAVGVAQGLGLDLPFYLQGGALLALPAVPGAYFYAIYRRQLGPRRARARRLLRLFAGTVLLATLFILGLALLSTRQPAQASTFFVNSSVLVLAGLLAIISVVPFFSLLSLGGDAARRELHVRANRIIVPYLFFALTLPPLSVLALWLNEWLRWSSLALFVTVAVTMVLTLPTYRPFRRLLDRALLGIALPPEHLLQTYAARITTSLERENLVGLLQTEILPTMLVRQSALLRRDESGEPEVIYRQNVAERALPSLPSSTEEDLHLPEWVRLALPLRIAGETTGFWFLGRRDPDDWYSEAELPIFQALADQTAVALHNIVQAETLHTLYQMNIERREEERNRLARELHDGVLGELGAIILYLDEETLPPQFHQAYQKLIARLRQTIGGLRPAMLNYGLRAGLEELADDLGERAGGSVAIHLEVPESNARYGAQAEQHLFRIVQQATENALRHAQAHTIRIDGRLEADELTLTIADDGVGIDADTLDLATLLAHDHFGLASMKERAALIGAELAIRSAPGRGTTVRVVWEPAGQVAS